MSNWSTVLGGVGPPVVGESNDYRTAARQSTDLCDTSREVNNAFRRLRQGCIDNLQGQAADELRRIVGKVDESLSDLPIVLSDVTRIMEDHERQLEGLKRSVREALARAKTRWDSYERAKSDVRREQRELSSLRCRLDGTPSTPENEEYIGHLRDLISSQEAQIREYRTFRNECQDRICGNMRTGKHPGHCTGADRYDGVSPSTTSCYQYMSLYNDEQALVRRTVDRLNGVDLRDLRDPNWFVRFLDAVSDWIKSSALWKAIDAALDGDWGAALHYLREALDAVIMVLTIAALVVGFFATGGLLGVLIISATIATVTHIGVSAYLAAVNTPHPETGQPVAWTEVGLDAALCLFGGAVARGGAHLVNRTARNMLKRSRWARSREFSKKLPVPEFIMKDSTVAKTPWKRAFKRWQGTNNTGNLSGMHTRRRHMKLELAAQLTEDFVLPEVSHAIHDRVVGQKESVKSYREYGPSMMSGSAVPLVCAK